MHLGCVCHWIIHRDATDVGKAARKICARERNTKRPSYSKLLRERAVKTRIIKAGEMRRDLHSEEANSLDRVIALSV